MYIYDSFVFLCSWMTIIKTTGPINIDQMKTH